MAESDRDRRYQARPVLLRLAHSLIRSANACVIVSLLVFGTTSAAAAEKTRNVLVLYNSTRVLPANIESDQGIREALDIQADGSIELFAEYLDIPRFGGDSYARTLASFLREKYAAHPPDVIIVGGEDTLAFLLRYRSLLFPQAPVVHGGVDASFLRSIPPLPIDVVGTPVEFDAVRTINLAFQLQPKANHLVLVTGSSVWDRRWEARLRSEVARYPAGATVEFLSGLPTGVLRSRLAALGDDAVIYTPGYFTDGDGRNFTPREAVQIMAVAAAAPIYGPLKPFIGTGAVGGYMADFLAVGRQAGQTTKALLDGATPGSLRLPASMRTAFNVDWRQVQRWGIDVNAIPRDAVVWFREPGLLDQYRSLVITATVAFLLQAALIAGLLFERRRRRVAKREAQERLLELAHMNRHVAMGGLVASIAHELNQPLGAIYNNAGAARMLIKADPPRLDEIAEILEDIQHDDKRASDVISRIRAMLAKAKVDFGSLDLNEAIGEAMKMLAADAAARGVVLKAELAPGLPAVHADRVQIQQVILNLVINAMEALPEQPGARREVVVRTARIDDKEAELSVVDSGVGIPPDLLPHIFNSLVTSKPGGMGLGLSISRTIAETHGGRIRAENLPGGGAAFHVTLPFESGKRA